MLKSVGAFFLLLALALFALMFHYGGDNKQKDNKIPKAEQGYEPVIALELFTSQGCSSCPPADALLKSILETNRNKAVYGIAYHVDYWNYIGWEDPFSTSSYTEKQRMYSRRLGNDRIYTPQLVINGQEDLVGSDSGKLASRVISYQKGTSENHLKLSRLEKELNFLTVSYEVNGTLKDKVIRGILVLDERITEVMRGENRGRRLVNNNIAINEKTIPLKQMKGLMRLRIPELVNKGETLHLIVFVENEAGHITAADKLSLTFDSF